NHHPPVARRLGASRVLGARGGGGGLRHPGGDRIPREASRDRSIVKRLSSPRTRELAGLALVFVAVAFNAVFLAPEIRISRLPLNAGILPLAAWERLAQALARGDPFLDPWVSEWALGYPMWRSYQPLPHLVAAGFLAIAKPFCSAAAAFAFLQYL